MEKKTPIQVKIALVGPYNVGKTSLVNRFVRDRFDRDTEPTIGAMFATKIVGNPSREPITLQIWDTAGSEKFKSLIPTYIRGAQIVLICFDGRDGILEILNEKFHMVRQYNNTCHVFLVRTKMDLSIRGLSEEIQEYAKSAGVRTYETSSLSGKGIENLFEDAGLIGAVLKKSELKPNSEDKDPLVTSAGLVGRGFTSGIDPRSYAGNCCNLM